MPLQGNSTAKAGDIIKSFALQPHPFDGWFAPVVSDHNGPERFHYMIKAGEYAAWHKCREQTMLTYIDGAPLTVSQCGDGSSATSQVLGNGRATSLLIEPDILRTWESLGAWTLLMVSTRSSKDFTLWQLAPDDWHPEAENP